MGRTGIAQQVHALALRAYEQINGSPDYSDGACYEEWTLAGGDPYIRRNADSA